MFITILRYITYINFYRKELEPVLFNNTFLINKRIKLTSKLGIRIIMKKRDLRDTSFGEELEGFDTINT